MEGFKVSSRLTSYFATNWENWQKWCRCSLDCVWWTVFQSKVFEWHHRFKNSHELLEDDLQHHRMKTM